MFPSTWPRKPSMNNGSTFTPPAPAYDFNFKIVGRHRHRPVRGCRVEAGDNRPSHPQPELLARRTVAGRDPHVPYRRLARPAGDSKTIARLWSRSHKRVRLKNSSGGPSRGAPAPPALPLTPSGVRSRTYRAPREDRERHRQRRSHVARR